MAALIVVPSARCRLPIDPGATLPLAAAMPLGVPLWGLVLSSWSLPNST